MPFIATDGRGIGPTLAINISPTDSNRSTNAAARRRSRQVRAIFQYLGATADIPYPKWSRGHTTVAHRAGKIIRKTKPVPNRVEVNNAVGLAAGGRAAAVLKAQVLG